MGWSSANPIFDHVAQELIDNDVDAEVTARVLAALIYELRCGDWDTLDESLDEFDCWPAVVEAFRRGAPEWMAERDKWQREADQS